ncbi:MAG: hypothetical protein QW404_01790 [Candidatus Nanoarchaeia archaeon]
MKKIILFVFVALLFSTFSFSMLPSEAVSWVVSVKDGTWTVKALGAATGKEGQEALSWVIDPQGKVTSMGMDALDKECNGCVSAGKLLLDPVGGITDVAMKEAISSNKELGVIQEISTIRSELSKLDVDDAEVKLAKREVTSQNSTTTGMAVGEETKPHFTIESTSTDIRVDSKIAPEVTAAAGKTSMLGSYKVVEGVGVFKPEKSGDYITFKGPMGNIITYKNLKQGSYIEFNKDNVVTKAQMIAEKDTVLDINGKQYELPAGATLKVDKGSCIKTDCATSITIEGIPQKSVLKPEGETLVDEVGKFSFCGNTYEFSSGTKFSIDVDKDGCTLNGKGEFKYPYTVKEQTLEFKNIKMVLDAQRYEHQKGDVRFEEGKYIKGTIKELKLDNAEIKVASSTRRKSQVTDTMDVTLTRDGKLGKATFEIKDRPISFSYRMTIDGKEYGDDLSNLVCKDTFFKVKSLEIQPKMQGKSPYLEIDPGTGTKIQHWLTEFKKPEKPVTVNIPDLMFWEDYSTSRIVVPVESATEEPEIKETDLPPIEVKKGEDKVKVASAKTAPPKPKAPTKSIKDESVTLKEYDPMLGVGELPFTYYN